MSVRVAPSPLQAKKWRAHLPDGTHVDFGQRGSEDFTVHKDAHRMARYLLRHGGLTARAYNETTEMSSAALVRAMRAKRRSSKEDWTDPHTPGFWSRWLLWSEPTMDAARARVRAVSGLRVTVR